MTNLKMPIIMLMLAAFGCNICRVNGAAIICGNLNPLAVSESSAKAHSADGGGDIATTTSAPISVGGEVKKFLHSVQCTIELAKPWVSEIEKETRRLQQSAKRIGSDVLSTFNGFMDNLMGLKRLFPLTKAASDQTTKSSTTTTSTTTTATSSSSSTTTITTTTASPRETTPILNMPPSTEGVVGSSSVQIENITENNLPTDSDIDNEI